MIEELGQAQEASRSGFCLRLKGKVDEVSYVYPWSNR